MTKAKPKMTLEKLAAMSQRQFLQIRDEMSGMKGEMAGMKEEMHLLRRDVEAGFGALSSGMKAVMDKLNDIQKDVIEIHDLRSRVERLEKKVGLPH